MAITVDSSGTLTTDATLQQLAAPTTSGNYVLWFDTTNLLNGEEIEVYVKRKVLTGGTIRTTSIIRYIHAQTDEPVKSTIPFVLPYGGTFHIKRIDGGSARNIDWSIERQ